MPRTLDGKLYLRVVGDMDKYNPTMLDPKEPGKLLDERWPLTPPGLIPPPSQESSAGRRIRIAKAIADSPYICTRLARVVTHAGRKRVLDKIINAEERKERRIYALLAAVAPTTALTVIAGEVSAPVDMHPHKARRFGAALLEVEKAAAGECERALTTGEVYVGDPAVGGVMKIGEIGDHATEDEGPPPRHPVTPELVEAGRALAEAIGGDPDSVHFVMAPVEPDEEDELARARAPLPHGDDSC